MHIYRSKYIYIYIYTPIYYMHTQYARWYIELFIQIRVTSNTLQLRCSPSEFCVHST